MISMLNPNHIKRLPISLWENPIQISPEQSTPDLIALVVLLNVISIVVFSTITLLINGIFFCCAWV